MSSSSVDARSLFLQHRNSLYRLRQVSRSRLQSAQFLLQSRRGLHEQGNSAVKSVVEQHVNKQSPKTIAKTPSVVSP